MFDYGKKRGLTAPQILGTLNVRSYMDWRKGPAAAKAEIDKLTAKG